MKPLDRKVGLRRDLDAALRNIPDHRILAIAVAGILGRIPQVASVLRHYGQAPRHG